MIYNYKYYSYENRCCLCAEKEIKESNIYGSQYAGRKTAFAIMSPMYKAKSYPLKYFRKKHLEELEQIDCDFAMGLEATG